MTDAVLTRRAFGGSVLCTAAGSDAGGKAPKGKRPGDPMKETRRFPLLAAQLLSLGTIGKNSGPGHFWPNARTKAVNTRSEACVCRFSGFAFR